jgi:iron complex transport system ATP-binding protein
MKSPASLTFQGLRYRYGAGPEALRDLGAEIAPGEVTAILGPNGAGKTTLLHLALGWLTPLSGRVLLDGAPISEMSRRELGKTLALVPQSERIPFEFSVLDYVLLGRAPHLEPLASPGKADVAVARTAIERVGIAALANRDITALSGGERQLATIARALAQEPRVLLLDEPTAHLDLANKARVTGLVKSLAQNGMTVILTTHEPDVASGAATRLLLMRQGQLLEAGALETLFNSASLSRTYGIPVAVRLVDGRLVALWETLGTDRAQTGHDTSKPHFTTKKA